MSFTKKFNSLSIFRDWRLATVLLYFLAAGCANEAPPTGGKKDNDPPKMKYASPANKSLNYHVNTVKMRFDEFIVQSLDPKEILISPPLDKNAKFLVNGKTLLIKLPTPLKDSTTYTINFGDAIKDNNENNILKNFTYVFSTGNKLDSASVSGSVLNIKEPTKNDDIVVALYPSDSVDGILHSKPFYFAKSDKIGNFQINNIHPGVYRAYALRDENLNYLYDQANELIGFSDTLLTFNDSSKLNFNINVFELKGNKPKWVDAAAVSAGKMLISYNSPVKTLKFDADILSPKDIIEVSDSKDSLTYWFSNVYALHTAIKMTVNDSITDTTRVDLKYFSKDTLADKKLYPLHIETQAIKEDTTKKIQATRPLLSPFKPIILTLSRPAIGIDSNKHVYVINDSTKKADTISYGIGDKTKRDLHVEFKQKEKTPYTLVIPDSTLQDQWGWWNTKMVYSWNADDHENYGNIILSVKFDHPDKYYIFKILDDQDRAVETFYYVGNAERKLTIKNVQAGIYHLQAIEDVNKNGEWDSGNFTKKRQPEKIINFKETYTLKGNWDLEVEVKL